MQHHLSSRLASALAAGCLLLLGDPRPIAAHHSTAEYDAGAIVEARGEVVSVLWRNPHVRFEVSTKSLDGNEQLWEIESADLTRLDRAGLPRNLLNVGDTITFAGNPSTRTERRMYVTNLLVADGREILLRGNVKPRWTTDRAVNTDAIPARAEANATPAGKRFFGRVFVPAREGKAPAWLSDPPLTAAARAGKAAYDEVVDDPVLGCVSPGMPRVMLRSGPYAVRFVERGADLVLQNEWFEIDRLIHMDGRAPPADAPYAPLGYSAGSVGRRRARRHDDAHRLAVLRALWLGRRAAEPRDAHRRALHAARRQRNAAVRLVRDRPRQPHDDDFLRQLRDVPLQSIARVPAVRLHRGRAPSAAALRPRRPCGSPDRGGRWPASIDRKLQGDSIMGKASLGLASRR